MRDLKTFSVILPVFNEAAGLPYLQDTMTAWMSLHPGLDFELVLVNDGSTDNSLSLLSDWASADARVRVISLSRNFGHQAAITAGLERASGQAVVVMDADLQHPLAAVDSMMEKYREGFDVVYGVKAERSGDGIMKKLTSWGFYRLQRWIFQKNMPMDANDFRLISRECLDAINALPERNRFIRGLVSWVGFKQTSVTYTQNHRLYGTTKFSFYKMLEFSWIGITSFSLMPIRFVTIMGFATAIMSMLFLCYALYEHLMSNTVEGWTTIVFLQAFIGGCILLGVGIVGEYIGKIYEEVKARPVYIVEKELSSAAPEKTEDTI